MVFDRDGNLVMSGADQEINGKTINPSWQHSGAVDWDGNVYIIERDAHRIVKLSPKLDKFLLQLGTTGENGNDATHFDLPSGIAVLRNGNIVVTDGYGNNRVVLFSQGRQVHQAGRQGRRRTRRTRAPARASGSCRTSSRSMPTRTCTSSIARTIALQVFDKNLNYIREIKNEGWNPWDIGISRKGNDGFGYIADHALERVHKISLKDGKILATWGKQGLGPGRVRLGARRRRRLERRRLRGRYVRPAPAEVCADGCFLALKRTGHRDTETQRRTCFSRVVQVAAFATFGRIVPVRPCATPASSEGAKGRARSSTWFSLCL